MLRIPPAPPTWDGWHPVLVHFPIALLPAAGVLILLALLLRRHANPLNLAALVVMALGLVGAFLAASSGEAAHEFAPDTPAVKALVHEHEEAAEAARNTFLAFTIVFAGYALVSWRVKAQRARPWILAAGVVFLLAYLAPCLILMNAGHLGGRLVHEQGVRARLSQAAADQAPAATPDASRHDDD